MSNNTTEARFYSVAQTAAILNVCQRTVYNMVARGDLPAARIGKHIFIPRGKLDAIVPEGTAPTAAI